MNKFYVTTAIPYVNASPHAGHAQEFVIADAIARYHKNILAEDVAFLSGADENSLKIVQAAEKEKLTPQGLTDKYASKFQELAKALNVKFDFFQRASDKKHHFPASQELWRRCKKEDIDKKKYQGLYCVGCETFYTKDELTEEGLCPEHLRKPEIVEEENYFFKLSNYQEWLLEQITKGEIEVLPTFRKNEVLAFINGGLEDFSISRSIERAKGWGVPVPGDSKQIMYVWFDALNVYQSGIGFGWDQELYDKWWPANVHVIGKGITRFHAIYWPAILKSAGLKIPKKILVHGYISVEGQKMSKSLGNVIDPFEIVNKYGTDALRYYLLREIPTFADGDFSYKRFQEIYNADLANDLGNLVSRVAKLCQNNKITTEGLEKSMIDYGYAEHMQKYELNLAVESLWREVKDLNQLINKEEVWKTGIPDTSGKISLYVNKILALAYFLSPFLPETAEKIVKQFKDVSSIKPLFPRIK